ncbi:MAG TPA: energy-coupled thiamine transporter ThiT [Oscillospiraceae bacterium]|nr:energy-coupled thiamine transporter ThiT [Oscillospiraceae bacterium]HPF55890.1 energy-coupled thiamine transporter ThiT [Clostridiales bacterium]HPK35015.1 energy-coupled thiamine transporter ThiT [Oscillospiraceae bacterium]HPR76264.1 energy-coupled thiamine transporter ThiT [Oscillospiraceae bacterium]
MATKKIRNKKLLVLTEGAIMVALSAVLSFLRIRIGAEGGSIDFAMIPLMVYALRRGVWPGFMAGAVAGMIQYFSEGYAVNIWSLIMDYPLAYMMIGLAGLMMLKKSSGGWAVGAVIGGFARYIVHIVSGVVFYASYASSTVWIFNTPTVWIYSTAYNALYMIPGIVISTIACAALAKPLSKALME